MTEQTKKIETEETNLLDEYSSDKCISLTFSDWAFIETALLEYNIKLRSCVRCGCDSDLFTERADRCIRLITLIDSDFKIEGDQKNG